MRTAPSLPRMALALGFALLSACATSRVQAVSLLHSQPPAVVRQQATPLAGGPLSAELLPVLIHTPLEGPLRLSFPALAPHSSLEALTVTEIRPLLGAFDSIRPRATPRLRLMEFPGATNPTQGAATAWEQRLREEFFSLYGPALLPVPESLESSRLSLALKLSTRYMGDGIREAAQELFNAPAFLTSVSLSILVYFAAWLAPEPFFSKAFVATLTVRLALLVGLVELGRLALACLRLHQEAEAATTHQELEAAAERFGRSVGGTALRVLVVVASLGVPQVLPKVPEGGLWTLLSPLRHAPAGGPALGSITTVQIVADGTLVVTGVATGTAAASLCGELAFCAAMDDPGGGPRLSTRYGKPHTRQNPPHNEAIEEELARREAAGHTALRKNKAQRTAQGDRVYDSEPVQGVRSRKPDVTSVRPDGVRHNTNYVSNARDVQRELTAFESMIRADPLAIHELYLLDGTLLRRYVPRGVSFP
ncbi:MAG TPA: hypothetical protein VFZ09_20335 [Archangium sp.]|uniref:hypothetical protein n=1 Tax=Archangium sp. TaxID=1872627 RepID=UPI002E2FECA7|nr:hypothetical protein [Archangium sp.]HEX5748600.1 hypothetical protein [Archangium sp.]